MQKVFEKYHVFFRGKKISVFIVSVFLQMAVFGQETQRIDTTGELKYEIDTSTAPDTLADTIGDRSHSDESVSENEPAREYFLRKEFTGGLPDTLNFRKVQEKVMKTLRQDKAFWYANETFKKKEKKTGAVNYSANPLFQSALWLVIIGGFIMVLVIYLSNSNAHLFRKSRQITAEEGETASDDIFTINYLKELDKAVAGGNYRLAVRLMFLRLLRDLSDKNIIQYKQDNTNFDYMMQLRTSAMYHDFFRLTRNYEYSWYGQFDIDKEKYAIIKNEFENFERRLN